MNSKIENIIPATEVYDNFIFETVDGRQNEFSQDKQEDLPIAALKEAVLSFDWEIDTETLSKFHKEIDRLEELWRQNKIALAFLRILSALGRYVGSNKAGTHTDAVKLLYSVYNGLERIILSPEMSNARKISLVRGELQKYNVLRQQLKHAREAARGQIQEKSEPDNPSPQNNDQAAPLQLDDTAARDDDDIIPALADIPLAEGTISQWSMTDLDQCTETEVRLAEFFGSDSEPGDNDGPGSFLEKNAVVPLADADKKLSTSTPSLDDPITEGATEESEAAQPQPQNIFDDLYSPAPSSPADDLLLDMHLDAFKQKAAGGENLSKHGEVEKENNPEACPISEGELSEQEISRKLNTFFDDGTDNPVDGCQAGCDNEVVPLIMDGSGASKTQSPKESLNHEESYKYSFAELVNSIDKSMPNDFDKEIANELEKIPQSTRERIEVKTMVDSLISVLEYSRRQETMSPDCLDILRVLATALQEMIPLCDDTSEFKNSAVLDVIDQFIRWQSGRLLDALSEKSGIEAATPNKIISLHLHTDKDEYSTSDESAADTLKAGDFTQVNDETFYLQDTRS